MCVGLSVAPVESFVARGSTEGRLSRVPMTQPEEAWDSCRTIRTPEPYA